MPKTNFLEQVDMYVLSLFHKKIIKSKFVKSGKIFSISDFFYFSAASRHLPIPTHSDHPFQYATAGF